MITAYSTISLIFSALYVGLFVFLVKGWRRNSAAKSYSGTLTTAVTILIAARNEEENIRLTIEDLLAQDYPRELTEIIIVDDHSTDRTAEIITSYADRGIRLLQLNEAEPLNSYKKKAIAEAIGLSRGELMVATDADCRMGPQWLSTIVGFYQENNLLMISSPVSYFQEKNWFERIQTLEFSFLIGVGAAFIGNDKAATCNGANFAYRKDAFYEVGGFKGIDDVASGDDELLLQKVAAAYPGRIGFLKNRNAIVYTHAKHSLQSFLMQRRRWASKSTKYKDKKIIAFAIGMWLFNVMLLANGLLSFFSTAMLQLFLLQMLLKCLCEFVFMAGVMAFVKRRELLAYVVPASFMHIIYLVYVGIMGNTGKYAWKGRLVR